MGESPKVSAKQTAPSSSGRSSYDVLLAAASVELSPAERKTIQVLSENNDETVRGLASILKSPDDFQACRSPHGNVQMVPGHNGKPGC